MSFPRYPKYKDSGVEWLGQVPEHWEVSRLGFESWVRARLGWKGLKAEEYVDDGFVFLSTPNIKGVEIDFDNVNYIDQRRFDESPEIQLKEGDVLLAKDGSTLGTVNVVRRLPRPATVNSSIAVITPGQRVDGIYMHYLFGTAYMENTIQRIKGGMGVPHLFQEDLNKFYVPIPRLNEQRAIATFLDRETAKIDALIAEQQRLIELLQEKRQAVISHAITKGLNPDAPMKDSGIEWLGEVPGHWRLIAVRRLLVRIEQGWSPECFARPAENEEWAVVKTGCVNRGTFVDSENKALPDTLEPVPEYEICAGDLLMSRASGSPELVGSTAYVHETRPRLMLSDKIFRLHPTLDVERRYLALIFNSPLMRFQIERAISGAEGLANNLPQSALKGFVCPLPPIDEQEAIVEYVSGRIAAFDLLSAKARHAITLLQERRSALISAAVMGQIDVRGLAGSEAA
jgi:type I restriction enzyme S subunit